ncbi:hypothetical protein [Nonomuraea bangladeshensis]|uniref:hypothetical protein n=1 Tax=Nonomuraea bangladeshensis TaxID=404385 RepID=UPI003C2F80A4
MTHDTCSLDWRQRFRHQLGELGCEPSESALLGSVFDSMTEAWSGSAVEDPRCFETGICPDGGPAELSIRAGSRNTVEIRFICQSHVPLTPSVWPSMSRVALDCLVRWTGRRAAEHAQRILARQGLLEGGRAVGSGNLRLWLGAGIRASGLVAKLYVNPWYATPELRGFPAVHSALDFLLPEADPLRWFDRLLTAAPNLSLNFFGLNFQDQGPSAGKAYFASQLTGTELLALIKEFGGCSLPDPVADRLGARGFERGEVHLTLLFTRGRDEPELSINLFCPHWYCSRDDLIQELRVLAPENDEFIGRIVRAQTNWPAERSFSFLGFAPSGITAYLPLAERPRGT